MSKGCKVTVQLDGLVDYPVHEPHHDQSHGVDRAVHQQARGENRSFHNKKNVIQNNV